MILRIGLMANNHQYFVEIPDRWAALEDDWFIDEFPHTTDMLYNERNARIDRWLGTPNWAILDKGDWFYFEQNYEVGMVDKVFD